MQGMLSRLTYANVIATLALFVALGGVGYAATQLPANSVGTAQIKNGAVTPSKLSKVTKVSTAPEVGAAGPKGEPGLTGPSGPRGFEGPRGEQGKPGTDASINGVKAGGDLSGTYPDPTVEHAAEADQAAFAAEAGLAEEATFLNGISSSGFLRYKLSLTVTFNAGEVAPGCSNFQVSNAGYTAQAGDYSLAIGNRTFGLTGLEANGLVQEEGTTAVAIQICNPTSAPITGSGAIRVIVVH